MSEIKDMDDWERQYYKLLGDTSDAEPANAPTWDDDRKLLRTYGRKVGA